MSCVLPRTSTTATDTFGDPGQSVSPPILTDQKHSRTNRYQYLSVVRACADQVSKLRDLIGVRQAVVHYEQSFRHQDPLQIEPVIDVCRAFSIQKDQPARFIAQFWKNICCICSALVD